MEQNEINYVSLEALTEELSTNKDFVDTLEEYKHTFSQLTEEQQEIFRLSTVLLY